MKNNQLRKCSISSVINKPLRNDREILQNTVRMTTIKGPM